MYRIYRIFVWWLRKYPAYQVLPGHILISGNTSCRYRDNLFYRNARANIPQTPNTAPRHITCRRPRTNILYILYIHVNTIMSQACRMLWRIARRASSAVVLTCSLFFICEL